MKTAILTLGLLTLALASCGTRVLRPSGPDVTQIRNTGSFTGLDFEVPVKAEVRIGGTPSVQLIGPKNILDQIRTSVEGSVLHLRFPNHTELDDNPNLRAVITMPQLSSLGISGTADVNVTGGVSGQTLDIDQSGAGTIRIDGVAVQRLEAEISGTGELQIGTGTARDASYDIAGAGEVSTVGMTSESVSVDMSGAGNIAVRATRKLYADLSGAGTLRYAGSPADVKTDVSGATRVERLP
jgi:hypothetical protein